MKQPSRRSLSSPGTPRLSERGTSVESKRRRFFNVSVAAGLLVAARDLFIAVAFATLFGTFLGAMVARDVRPAQPEIFVAASATRPALVVSRNGGRP